MISERSLFAALSLAGCSSTHSTLAAMKRVVAAPRLYLSEKRTEPLSRAGHSLRFGFRPDHVDADHDHAVLAKDGAHAAPGSSVGNTIVASPSAQASDFGARPGDRCGD